MPTTPEYNLPYPLPGDPADVSSDMEALARAVELAMTDTVMPAGVIVPFGGTAAPAGWLLCNGAEYEIVAYPRLGAVLGSTYGTAQQGHFRVPDLRGRTALGAGTGVGQGAAGAGQPAGTPLTARDNGAWGGDERAQQHAHNTEGAGGHTHGMDEAGVHGHGYMRTHSANYEYSLSSGASKYRVNYGEYTSGTHDAGNHAHTIRSVGNHSHVVQSSGEGQQQNMPPFTVVTHIIKV